MNTTIELPDNPIDQLEGELEVEWILFKKFLTWEERPRDFKRFAEIQGKSIAIIRKYSSKNKWMARVRAWETAAINKEINARTIARKRVIKSKMQEREQIEIEQLKVLRAMRILGTAEINRRLKILNGNPNADIGITIRDAVSLIKEAIQFERLLMGESTSRVENINTDKKVDLSQLDAFEAETLVKLLDKCNGMAENNGENTESEQ